MTCAEHLNTQAFIDGEVAGAAAEAAERHILGCLDCQAFCADAATLSDDIRVRAVRRTAPAALRAKVSQALDLEISTLTKARTQERRIARRSFWRGAFGGAGLSGLAAALVVLAILPPSPSTLTERISAAHAQALMDGRAIAVVSSDHHTVKPWFAGRIAISPPVADFADQGFKLVGGRLDTAARQPAAVVVYQHRRHEIDLFVWADRGGALPANGLSHGWHMIFWKEGDLDLAAVSDTQLSDLTQFTDLVRAEPE